jgi:uncharacterized membrane protein
MNTSHGIDQVDRYLRELSAALSGLSANDRDEVVAGIREHIDAALSSIERPSADDIDRVLRHLGDPLAIAAETTGRLPPRPAESLPMLERDWIPAATVLSLIMGTLFFWAVVPLVLWLLGLVLLWISPLWHLGEKILGTLAFPAVILAIALPGFFAFSSSGGECVSDAAVVEDDSYQQILHCPEDGGTQWLPVSLGLVVIIGILVVVAVMLWRRGLARVPR